MNKLIFVITTVALMGSANSFAEERLNGREAANACKTEITNTYAGDSEIDFSRNPASSMRGGAYTFWINSTEELDGDKSSVKYLCEITRSGELVSLTREEGRWRI